MIIWVNGPFGVGKTQTANELNRRIENSFLFDPENLGYFLQKNFPKNNDINDFQDYEFWRKGNFELLLYLHQHYKGTIIVPMTLYNEKYFNEIVGNLRENLVEVHHFSLLATQETIKKRLKKRLDFDQTWALSHLQEILNSLSQDKFETIIYTDNLTIDQVVEQIGEKCHLKLKPRIRNPLKKLIRRIHIQIKNIR